MPVNGVIGWDIGGAHLKAARVNGDGRVSDIVQLPCPLWQGLQHLQSGIGRIRQRFEDTGVVHAVTMTGELVDLFSDRADGVRSILKLLQEALGARALLVYAGRRGFWDVERAVLEPEGVASANWLASVEWAESVLDTGALLDIGSTTTDIVPFSEGRAAAVGNDDFQRLCSGALVYTGVVRTPVFALARQVPFEGKWLPMMAEQFAHAADVYRLTGQLPGDADQHPCADNGAKTVEASARRLARMLGRDAASAAADQWLALAHFLADAQATEIARSCRTMLSRLPCTSPITWVGAGVGRFLARVVAQRVDGEYREFGDLCAVTADRLRHQASDCAPAAAVAQLAWRRETG